MYAWPVVPDARPLCTVILEAQALLMGEASGVDVNNEDILALRVLRDMVAGRPVHAPDLAAFLLVLSGSNDSADTVLWRGPQAAQR
jgi:hypothetical protein